MQNRLIQATLDAGRREASRTAALAIVLRDTASGFFTTARYTLTMIGLLAVGAAVLLFARPELAEHALAQLSPQEEGQAAPAPETSLATALLPLPAAGAAPPQMLLASEQNSELLTQQQRVADWIARRYRVAGDATQLFVSTAYQTAKELKLDPLLILSVMAIESRFNPFAESPVGAQGLMQVMSHLHKEKFEPLGGIEAALNPVANIQVGSRILKEYVKRGGSVEAGLKMYVGAALLETDFGYGAKVLAEHSRLKEVAMGRKVSIYANTARRKPAPAAPTVPTMQEAAAPGNGKTDTLVQAEQVAASAL